MDSASPTQQRDTEPAEPPPPPTPRREASLQLMLEILQEQDHERQRSAGPLAASLLHACTSRSGKVLERAQVTAHEVLRYVKAGSAQRASTPASNGEESLLPTCIRGANSVKGGRAPKETTRLGSRCVDGATSTQQDFRNLKSGQGVDSTNGNGVIGDGLMNTRPRSKADRCREGLLQSAFQATK